MIAPSTIERLGRNVALAVADAEGVRLLAKTYGLDMQDEATLLRLASGEAMATYLLTGALAEHA